MTRRRKFVIGTLSVGSIAISGCMGVFDESGEGGTEENVDDITYPEYLSQDGINENFVSVHRQELTDVEEFVLSSSTAQSIITKSYNSDMYLEVESFSENVSTETVYYADDRDRVSRNESNGNYSYARGGEQIPSIRDILEVDTVESVIESADLSVQSVQEDSILEYVGTSEMTFINPETRDTVEDEVNLTVHVDINRPHIKLLQAEYREMDVYRYEVSSVGDVTGFEPEWTSEVPENVENVVGNFYSEGNLLILQPSSGSQLSSGSRLFIIKPDGESTNTTLSETVTAENQLYIGFESTGDITYSTGDLPQISNRESLQNGTYIVIGSLDGEQIFETEILVE